MVFVYVCTRSVVTVVRVAVRSSDPRVTAVEGLRGPGGVPCLPCFEEQRPIAAGARPTSRCDCPCTRLVAERRRGEGWGRHEPRRSKQGGSGRGGQPGLAGRHALRLLSLSGLVRPPRTPQHLASVSRLPATSSPAAAAPSPRYASGCFCCGSRGAAGSRPARSACLRVGLSTSSGESGCIRDGLLAPGSTTSPLTTKGSVPPLTYCLSASSSV